MAGACRFVWNHFVTKLQDDYRYYGECDYRFYSLVTLWPGFRKFHPWLNDYPSHVIRQSLKAIETQYKAFFKGQGGLPKRHGRYTHAASIPLVKGSFKLNGNSLHIAKIGQVSLIGNNPYPESKAVSGTVKYECGHWYAYIVHEVKVTALPAPIKAVGIDRNVGQITLSDSTRYDAPKNDMLEARARRYRKMMSRRGTGNRKQGIKPSNRYQKAQQLHARTAQKIAQQRTNWCHHVSKEIARKYNLVYLEDLNTRGMTASAKGTADNPGRNVRQKAGLNRSILSSAWGKLEQCLSYKSNVIRVPAPYTSQRCHECGHTEKANRKTQSEFICQSCGHSGNADHNAALNILAFGNGAAARGGCQSNGPMKREMDTGAPN